MTLAPEPGEYIVGDLQADGHTHILHIGEHPLDEEFPEEGMSTLRGDFPKATSSAFYHGFYHAHSMTADPNQDKTLICGESNESETPHIHTIIKKVK